MVLDAVCGVLVAVSSIQYPASRSVICVPPAIQDEVFRYDR